MDKSFLGFSIISNLLLPPLQIVDRFSLSKFIDIVTHLDIHYIYVRNNIYEPKKAKTIYNLKWSSTAILDGLV